MIITATVKLVTSIGFLNIVGRCDLICLWLIMIKSSATWPSLPKKYYNDLNQTKP